MKTIYEWTLETVEDGDVAESDFSEDLGFYTKELKNLMDDPEEGEGARLGLYIRKEGEGKCLMFWGYASRGEDGKLALPETAESADGVMVKIPARFHKELAKCQI